MSDDGGDFTKQKTRAKTTEPLQKSSNRNTRTIQFLKSQPPEVRQELQKSPPPMVSRKMAREMSDSGIQLKQDFSIAKQKECLKPISPIPSMVQAKGDLASSQVGSIANQGFQGSSTSLPHLNQVQKTVGPSHNLSSIQAYIGGPAAKACDALGATAYACDNRVAFKSNPDVHTAGHEACHVLQQRSGVSLTDGIGRPGDKYEKQADEVGNRASQGSSARDILGAVQKQAQASVLQKQDSESGNGSTEISFEDDEIHSDVGNIEKVRRIISKLDLYVVSAKLALKGLVAVDIDSTTRAAYEAASELANLAEKRAGSEDEELLQLLEMARQKLRSLTNLLNLNYYFETISSATRIPSDFASLKRFLQHRIPINPKTIEAAEKIKAATLLLNDNPNADTADSIQSILREFIGYDRLFLTEVIRQALLPENRHLIDKLVESDEKGGIEYEGRVQKEYADCIWDKNVDETVVSFAYKDIAQMFSNLNWDSDNAVAKAAENSRDRINGLEPPDKTVVIRMLTFGGYWDDFERAQKEGGGVSFDVLFAKFYEGLKSGVEASGASTGALLQIAESASAAILGVPFVAVGAAYGIGKEVEQYAELISNLGKFIDETSTFVLNILQGGPEFYQELGYAIGISFGVEVSVMARMGPIEFLIALGDKLAPIILDIILSLAIVGFVSVLATKFPILWQAIKKAISAIPEKITDFCRRKQDTKSRSSSTDKSDEIDTSTKSGTELEGSTERFDTSESRTSHAKSEEISIIAELDTPRQVLRISFVENTNPDIISDRIVKSLMEDDPDLQNLTYIGKVDKGKSDAVILESPEGMRYLFKATRREKELVRAREHGILPGSHSRRAAGAADLGEQLGIDTPEVRVVRVDNEIGSLQEFIEVGDGKFSIDYDDLKLHMPELFDSVTQSSKYKKLQADIDVFDYLLDSIDRNQGNIKFVIDEKTGKLDRLIALDHDNVFTNTDIPFRTRMPDRYTPEMVENIEHLYKNQDKFIETMNKFLEPDEVEQLMLRLMDIRDDMRRNPKKVVE